MTEPKAPPNKKHKWALWGSIGFFTLSGFVWLIYWLVWGQFHETTNDSYVNGNMIMITPQEPGIVTTILADNAQLVEAGQPLVELDRHDYEIALQAARANLGNTVRQVVGLFLKVKELEAKREVTEADLFRARLDYQHRLALVTDISVSKEDFEHSEAAFAAAIATVAQVGRQLAAAKAEVENSTVPTHPLVERAKSNLRTAFLALHRCTVLAPARGIVTQRKAQVGQWIKGSDPLMSLVPLDQIWVDANFREVDLKNIRIGQPVELFSDMYGRGQKYHGRVVGLNPGTGSVFSILPPQNATGNWIKIVQRIPVKISLDPEELKARPLVLGLSMTVTIDTHTRTGLQLPAQAPAVAVYSTGIYIDELEGVDQMVDKIISDNWITEGNHEASIDR
jgi:membrane fusion protein, multidrug efflux system